MITIKDAAKKLGTSEEIIRFSLESLLPSTFDTIKEISDDQFEAVAQTFKAKATGALPPAATAKDVALMPTNALSDEDKEKVIRGTIQAFADFEGNYQLQIESIAFALAEISARRLARGFIEVHDNVMRTELDQYFSDVSKSQMDELYKTANGGGAKDFLSDRGYKQTTYANTVSARVAEAQSILKDYS